MTLKKILLKSGVNKENTRYQTEGGWYDCDKIRFRQGTPEKIGGWAPIQSPVVTFQGICRSLWNWVTLGSQNLIAVGTNLKYYLEQGGAYNDITPIRSAVTLTNPFATTTGSQTVTVTDANGGYQTGDFVTFYGGSAVGGITITGQYQITVVSATTYTITVTGNPTTATGGGTVRAVYQINTGPAFVEPLNGWGASTWGSGAWGIGQTSTDAIRVWSQSNFGEDLIFGPRGGPIYYWDASLGVTPVLVTITIAAPAVVSSSVPLTNGTPIRLATTGALPTNLLVGELYYVVNSTGSTFNLATTAGGSPITTTGTQSGAHTILVNGALLSSYGDASGVPLEQNYILVSDINRFVFAFGANDVGSATFDPMLVRWSDQEDPYNWTPAATNQAGSLRLSRGSEIVTATQSRQEVLVWTDAALYSLQYVGAPIVWGGQLVGENISIVSQNAVAYANGVSYWMGKDKFYKYDGRVSPMRCDLRRYIFEDINVSQYPQIFSGTNEQFHEIWWFYCSHDSETIDRYVVYNYMEDIWYNGTMARTAWLDSGLRQYPLAATYSHTLVNHEQGINDNEAGTASAITSYITSAEFDLEDGHQFAFIWRVLPDITFEGSTAAAPKVTMYLLPLKNSGSGYSVNSAVNAEHSVGGTSFKDVTRTAILPVERFTGQIFTRVRGRQLAIKVESTDLDVTWQLGAPRVDLRPDGRR